MNMLSPHTTSEASPDTPRITDIARTLITRGKPTTPTTATLAEPDGFERLVPDGYDTSEVGATVRLLGQGGYNDVWHVTWQAKLEDDQTHGFVLRIPRSDSLKPHQICNEACWLHYMAENCPSVPVPRLYAYSDGIAVGDHAFVAEEYIDAVSLSGAWKCYNEPQKHEVARNIAQIVIQLAEVRFDAIGGMLPTGSLGPTVEGAKLVRGRKAFHNPDYYDIGPYTSVEQYVLSYYDKEICYYSYAPDSDFDDDTFELEPRSAFVQRLKEKRALVKDELRTS